MQQTVASLHVYCCQILKLLPTSKLQVTKVKYIEIVSQGCGNSEIQYFTNQSDSYYYQLMCKFMSLKRHLASSNPLKNRTSTFKPILDRFVVCLEPYEQTLQYHTLTIPIFTLYSSCRPSTLIYKCKVFRLVKALTKQEGTKFWSLFCQSFSKI